MNHIASLKHIPEVIAESPGKQSERRLYKSADAKQLRGRDNSEKKEELEAEGKHRRLSINLLHIS